MELRIENVSKKYGKGIVALDNISLTIPAGMYGLLGPNGAGKSTLMRILATLQDPDSGRVTLGNVDVVRDKSEVRKRLGYLPQDFGLLKNVTAIDLLDQFALMKGILKAGERREAVELLLQQTNLWDARRQKVGGFSGGMRQRFGVAVALLGHPQLLIVDEPTAGLDPTERVRFLNLLSEVGENSIVILSTHIVDDVAELCTKMAIINKGRILLEGEPTDAVNSLDGNVWSRIIDKNELSLYMNRLRVISTRLSAGRTMIRVFSPDRPGEGFELTAPVLEDVYFCSMKSYTNEAISAVGEGHSI